MQPEQLKEILEIGIRAISTCNNQPWRFRVKGDVLEVYVIRTKNFFLKLGGNSWIELGTLLENITVAAGAKGFQMEYELFEHCGLDEPAATVRFTPKQVSGADIGPLLRRCTNRAPYSDKLLPPDVVASVLKNNDMPDITIQVLTGTKKNTCAQILTDLEKVRLCNSLIIAETLPYIRFDPEEIEKHRDRLDVRTMDLNPAGIKFLQSCKNHPKLFTFYYWITKKLDLFKKQETAFNHSGALIVFLINKKDQVTYVNLGRVIQRTLNLLTAHDVQSFPWVGGLYLLDLLKENLEIFSQDEQLSLLRYQYNLQSFFNFSDKSISMFIRAGYADPPKFHSLRKKIEDMMLKN